MSEVVLETVGLRKSFGALVVTDGISLRLPQGARHAVIGPNGAGKTTLLGLLSGVMQPDEGRIIFLGEDITQERPARRVRRGLVRTFQITNLFRELTVLENIFLAVSEHRQASRGMFGAAFARRDLLDEAERVIEALRLGDDRHAKVSRIAYGRQRLVEIALALSLEPKLLMLDEPAAGVPGAEVGLLLEIVERLPADITILMIEHDMQIVRRFATQVSVLVAGAVLMTGPPAEIMASEAVRSVYLGQSGHVAIAR